MLEGSFGNVPGKGAYIVMITSSVLQNGDLQA